MGLIVDTNVFIHFERRGDLIDLSPWDPSEDVFISAVTVSELLMGVYRADSDARRKRRTEFVEGIIAGKVAAAGSTACSGTPWPATGVRRTSTMANGPPAKVALIIVGSP